MRPLTDTCPKPLLKVGGRRLIEYHLLALAKAGVTDVVINYAWLGRMFPQTLGDGSRYHVNIHYSNEGDQALETAGGIIRALPLLGNDPFIVVNADIWTDFQFETLPDTPQGLAHLVLVDNPPHHSQGDFEIDANGHVHDRPALTYSGIGVYSPALFEAQQESVLPLAPLLRHAMSEGKVTGEHFTGQWWDIGTPQRLHELDSHLNRAQVS